MENRAKLRFPRSLLSSLTSCRTQNLLSDVIHNHQSNHQLNPIFSSEIPLSSASSPTEPLLPPPTSPVRHTSSYASICKPRCPETFDQMVRESCILTGERKKVCGSDAFFQNKCPPVSPLKPYFKLEKQRKNEKKKKKNKKWRRARFGKERSDPFSSSCEEWFSSDDEREDDVDGETETETETLFSSSRSFLSLSSDPDSIGSARIQTRRRPPSAQRREARRKRGSEVKAAPLEEKVKVKGSFAVVKRSSDPYNDFRTSMVEMIMEKQIFGAKELQQLLHCFLSLNPSNHHRIIVEVFAEICDALFSDLC